MTSLAKCLMIYCLEIGVVSFRSLCKPHTRPPSILHFTRFWGDHTKFHARVSHISILEEVVLGRNPGRHFAKVLLIGWLIACWNLLLLSLACWCLWHAHNRSTQWKVFNSFIPKNLDAVYHFSKPEIFKDLQKGFKFSSLQYVGQEWCIRFKWKLLNIEFVSFNTKFVRQKSAFHTRQLLKYSFY